MPNIDEIFARAESAPEDAAPSSAELDPNARPWHGLEEGRASHLPPLDHWKIRTGFEEPVKLWYASTGSILRTLRSRAKMLVAVFACAAPLFVGAASLIPSSYFSTLQLYAPEKTDSISSRLQIFSNKIEFASFPVDFRIPLGLIARRLKSPVAQAWVLDRYAAEKTKLNLPTLDPRLVRTETFYAEGSEILVIEGYANDPEAAVTVTNLYWEYLETEIKSLRDENLKKVQEWIRLTSQDWRGRFEELSRELASVRAGARGSHDLQIASQLGTQTSTLEIKRITLNAELDGFKNALASGDDEALFRLPEADIQDLNRVRVALKDDKGASAGNLVERAKAIAQQRLDDHERELAAVNRELRLLNSKMQSENSSFKSGVNFDSREAEISRQRADYSGRLEDLEKLKTQIDIENTLTHAKLRPIQPAVADPTTRRPSQIVKYSVAVFAALFATIFALIVIESQWAYAIRRELK